MPEGELIPREPQWRYAAYAGGNIALAGETDDPTLVIAGRSATAPVIAHDAKALGDVPPNLVFDTAVAGYLLDPARRGYPLDELAEERGIAADAGDELATFAVLIHALAQAQRPQIEERGLTRPDERGRAAARARPARDREGRHQARHEAAGDGRDPDPGAT